MKNPIEENHEVNQGTEKYPEKKLLKIRKKCGTQLVIKEMQTKTIMEYNFSPCKLSKFNEKFEKYQNFPPN